MGFLSSFTHPKDLQWCGPQRWHHIIFFAKNIVLVYFVILVIIHSAVFKFQFNDHGNDVRYLDFERHWYIRVGLAIIPDCLYTFFLILLIQQRTAGVKGFWAIHPVALLALSLVMSGLYAAQACLHALVFSFKDPAYRKEAWEKVERVEVGFQAAFGLFYLGMAGFAGLAVWRWRRGKAGWVEEEGLEN